MALLRRRATYVVVATVVCALAALGVSLSKEPQYDATVIMLAGQGEGIADVTAIDAITKATQTLARMGTNRVVIEQALNDAGLAKQIDAQELSTRVSSSVPVNTQQIEITVRDTDPERAALLANKIGKSFSAMVDERAIEASNLSATVWQPAIEPETPSSPNLPLNLALGLVLGLMLGVALALVADQLDQAWSGEEELEDLLGAPVLAAIQETSSHKARNVGVYA